MKNSFINFMIVLGVLIFSSSVQAQASSFDPNLLKAEYFNDEGVKEGLVFDDKKGNTFKIKNSKYSRGLYIQHDGKWLKHGVFYSVSSGRVTSKTMYFYGKKHGEHLGYHSNGKTQFQYYYNQGKKEGKWYQYRDDGSLFEEKVYENGVIEGTKISYHSNGVKNFVSTYINGKRNGESFQYNDDGELVGKSQYNMGKKVGKTQWYH